MTAVDRFSMSNLSFQRKSPENLTQVPSLNYLFIELPYKVFLHRLSTFPLGRVPLNNHFKDLFMSHFQHIHQKRYSGMSRFSYWIMIDFRELFLRNFQNFIFYSILESFVRDLLGAHLLLHYY